MELQRNFKLMRDLDGRAQTIMQEIDRLGGEFLVIAGDATQEKRKEHVAKIHVSTPKYLCMKNNKCIFFIRLIFCLYIYLVHRNYSIKQRNMGTTKYNLPFKHTN